MGRTRGTLTELVIIIAALLWPFFFYAKTIDGDEFLKSGVGLATLGMVVAVYKLWLGTHAGQTTEKSSD